jgi:hypothetical protein
LIPSDALGELKDGAAGLVALSELLGSRRVGPKAVAAALPAAVEACAGIAQAAESLAAYVLSVLPAGSESALEAQGVYDRATASVRALEAEAITADGAPGDARTRLVLERCATAASARVAAGLFIAEMFASASSPRTVSVRVADVLGFGPALAEGPLVVRATLDSPLAPVATTDARLLRSLVELGVQIVAAAGVATPHVQVTGDDRGGARIRVGPSLTPLPPSSGFPLRRPARAPASSTTALAVKRLPFQEAAPALARAAAAMAGASVSIDPSLRGFTLVFS